MHRGVRQLAHGHTAGRAGARGALHGRRFLSARYVAGRAPSTRHVPPECRPSPAELARGRGENVGRAPRSPRWAAQSEGARARPGCRVVQVASAPTSLCSCSARVGRGTTDVKKPALDVQRRRRGQFPAGEKRPIVGLARPATALRQGSHPPTQPSPAAQAPPSPSGRGTWFVSGLEKMASAGRQPEAVGLTRGQA